MIDNNRDELLRKSLTLIRQLKARVAELEGGKQDAIAVVGISCRLPGGVAGLEDLYQLLKQGKDGVASVPPDRWNAESLPPDTREAGFLGSPRAFDAEFFRMAPLEAKSLDPQQRLLLEVCHESLEHASLPSESLKDTKTGVFVGIGGQDYFKMLANRRQEEFDSYMLSGTSHSTAAGRLAFHLGLSGPALAVDTACSSSLVAAHLACQSLRHKECDIAIVGGVNRILNSDYSLALSRSGMLSPDCRCKVFDRSADGFVRAEGCVVMVFKRLSEALENGDRVLGVVSGSAINQDGRTSGLTVPSGPAQVSVIQSALREAGLEASEVGFVETHGTGTRLGDPIELGALQAVYGQDRKGKLRIGSLKSNIGHCEAAAGLAGLAKAVLCVQKGEFLANLHFQEATEQFPWQDSVLEVVGRNTTWTEQRRISGVSSFGFSGTNAHLVLENPPCLEQPSGEEGLALLTLSAKSEKALRELQERYLHFLQDSDSSWLDIAHTSRAGRNHYRFRIAVLAESKREARETLSKLEPVETEPSSRGVFSQNGQSFKDLKEAYLAGADIVWRRQGGSLVTLPTYPWQHRDFWYCEEELSLPSVLEVATQVATEACRTPDELLPRLEQWVCQQAARIVEELEPSAVRPPFERLWQGLKALASQSEAPEVSFGSLLELAPDSEIILQLSKRCSEFMPSVLRGETEALEVLFSHGKYNLPELYRHSAGLKKSNQRLAAAVAKIVESKGKVRILEVGGGTGSTTRYLLELLSPESYHYVFTDVAQNLVAQAAREFSHYPVETRILDLEAPIVEPGSYDLIIASNVIHATQDLRHSLTALRGLLEPGGWLILLESTQPTGWVSLVSGMTGGWWRYTDEDLRQNSPLIDVPAWIDLLGECGYQSSGVVPCEDSETRLLAGQAILLAQNGPSVPSKKTSSTNGSIPRRSQVSFEQPDGFLQELRVLPEGARHEKLQSFVSNLLCHVLGYREAISPTTGFCDLGMDSLSSLTFRNKLERALQLKLSGTLIYSYPNLSSLTRHLLSLIFPAEESTLEESLELLLDQKLESLEKMLNS